MTDDTPIPAGPIGKFVEAVETHREFYSDERAVNPMDSALRELSWGILRQQARITMGLYEKLVEVDHVLRRAAYFYDPDLRELRENVINAALEHCREASR